MTTRLYSRDELMEHLRGIAENSRTSPMTAICAEAYDEIDRLVDEVARLKRDLGVMILKGKAV